MEINIFSKKLIMILLISTTVSLSILTGEKIGLLLASVYGILLLIIFFSKKNILIDNAFKPYIGVFFLSTASIFYALDLQFVFNVYWKIVAYLLFFIVSNSLINSKKDLLFYLVSYLIFSSILASFNILVDSGSNNYRDLAFGGSNPVALTMLIAIYTVIILYNSFEIKWPLLSLPLTAYCMFLTASQKVIVALIITFTFYIFYNLFKIKIKKFFKGIFIFLALATLSFIVLSNITSLKGAATRTFATMETLITGQRVSGAAGGVLEDGDLRDVLVDKGIEYFAEAPIFGYGINNYRELNGQETGLYTYSHNTTIELLVGIGFIGPILFYLIYFNLFKTFLKIRKQRIASWSILLVGMLISTIFLGNYMEIYFSQIIGYFFLIYINSFKFLNDFE